MGPLGGVNQAGPLAHVLLGPASGEPRLSSWGGRRVCPLPITPLTAARWWTPCKHPFRTAACDGTGGTDIFWLRKKQSNSFLSSQRTGIKQMHFSLMVVKSAFVKSSIRRTMLKSTLYKNVPGFTECKVHQLCDWRRTWECVHVF